MKKINNNQNLQIQRSKRQENIKNNNFLINNQNSFKRLQRLSKQKFPWPRLLHRH